MGLVEFDPIRHIKLFSSGTLISIISFFANYELLKLSKHK